MIDDRKVEGLAKLLSDHFTIKGLKDMNKYEEYFMNRLRVLGFNMADLDKMEKIYDRNKNGYKVDMQMINLLSP